MQTLTYNNLYVLSVTSFLYLSQNFLNEPNKSQLTKLAIVTGFFGQV